MTGGRRSTLFFSAMPRFHLFGDSRHTAEQSGFFKWFMLDPVAPDTPGARLAAHYRPKGPAFHDLTEFIVLDDEDDKLQSLELRLARAFIDHPRKIHEIESLREVSVPVITAPRPEVHLPNQPTPGYRCFRGSGDGTSSDWGVRGWCWRTTYGMENPGCESCSPPGKAPGVYPGRASRLRASAWASTTAGASCIAS